MDKKKPSTVYELILAAAQRVPDSVAIHYINKVDDLEHSDQQTYEQLLSSLHRTVDMIRNLTGKLRPVVSLLLPNIPQAQTLLWASEIAGIANPLNPLLSEEALYQLMSKAETDIIFALGPVRGSELWEKAVKVAKRLPSQPICVSVLSPAGEHYYDSQVHDYSDQHLAADEVPIPTDVAAYFHTGGTTGTPKLACHTHANQTSAALTTVERLCLSDRDVMVNGLPIFHVAGAIINSLSPLGAGATVVLPTLAGFRNPEVVRQHWRLVQDLRVTITGGIPTSMASILDVPLQGEDVSSLRLLLSGGAPVPASLHQLAQERLGIDLYQGYGMTECCGVIAMPNLDKPSICGSVGRVAEPIEVLVDSGEVLVRSPMVFPGYLGAESPVTVDGWLRTGDLGHMDADGNLFITGRAKDLIIRSGHNIDPALIEGCLERHPAVSMAAAIGMPDVYAGELPVAYVQLRSGVSVTSEALAAFASENIDERPACPKKVIILDALPVTAIGKVFKPKLREDITNQLLSDLLSQRISGFGVQSRHMESGQLAIRLWGIPSSDESWCRDQLARLNLQIEVLLTK